MLQPSGLCDIYIKPRDATPEVEWTLVGSGVEMEFSNKYEDYAWLPTRRRASARKTVTLRFDLEHGEYAYREETKQEKRARLIREMYPNPDN